MWEERKSWNVSWSGTTIWGYDYSDSKYFDDEYSALAFRTALSAKNGVDYINLEESTIWRRKNK